MPVSTNLNLQYQQVSNIILTFKELYYTNFHHSSLIPLERIKELMSGTTVAQLLNQGTLPGLGCNQSRVPFLGTFLGKQKGTDNFIDNVTSIQTLPLTVQ